MFIKVKCVGKYEMIEINGNNINALSPYYARNYGRTYTMITMTNRQQYLVEDSIADIKSKM